MKNLPQVKLIPSDKKKWVVIEDFSFKTLLVPRGFKTDLASIPRLLWILFPPFGLYTTPAVIHDYMYTHTHKHEFSRKETDLIFKSNCVLYGVPKWKAWLFYRGVRIGGRGNWDND